MLKVVCVCFEGGIMFLFCEITNCLIVIGRWGGVSSLGKASDQKARHNTDGGSIPQCGTEFFSQSHPSE